jgi:hypothetical protein
VTIWQLSCNKNARQRSGERFEFNKLNNKEYTKENIDLSRVKVLLEWYETSTVLTLKRKKMFTFAGFCKKILGHII